MVKDNLVYNYEIHFTDYFDQKGFKYDYFVKEGSPDRAKFYLELE